MKDIVTVGEILIDLTFNGRENGVPHYTANPGGAPANVAVAASRLGARTAFIGKVGRDYFGDFLRRTLEENNVDVSGMLVDPFARTTMAVVSLSETGERSFSFYRLNCADILLRSGDISLPLLSDTRFLHFGSVSLTDEPSRTATLYAVDRAKEAGATITYDPNYRANLWKSEAQAVERIKSVLGKVDILKISDEELPLLTGTTDYDAGTRQLYEDYGIPLILLTLGADGAYYRRGGETGKAAGFKVKVADTNGAGDTFFGAFLSRMVALGVDKPADLSPEQLYESVRTANLAASITTSRHGAIPAMPELKELKEREEKLRQEAPDQSPTDLVERVIEELDLYTVCSAMPDAERRIGRLSGLISMAETFRQGDEYGLHRFVLWLQNMERRGQEPPSCAEGGDAVRILSIHKSKGLEFPVVFCSGLGRSFNRQDSYSTVLVHPVLGLGPRATDLIRKLEYPTAARRAIDARIRRESLSEEMRLLYVAMTRAKERLILTACVKNPDDALEDARNLIFPSGFDCGSGQVVKIPAQLLQDAGCPLQWILPAVVADDAFILNHDVLADRETDRDEIRGSEDKAADPELLRLLDRNLAWEYPHAEAQRLPHPLPPPAGRGRPGQRCRPLPGAEDPGEDRLYPGKSPGNGPVYPLSAGVLQSRRTDDGSGRMERENGPAGIVRRLKRSRRKTVRHAKSAD